MNLFSVKIVLPALRILVINRLQEAIQFQGSRSQKINVADDCTSSKPEWPPKISLQKIPLNRIKDRGRIQYGSAIALKLAQGKPDIAIEIAETIQSALMASITKEHQSEMEIPPLNKIWQQFSVETCASGWLYLQLSTHGLGEWLQLLNTYVFNRKNHVALQANAKSYRDYLSDSTTVFTIQYTHARCCSLLRLAESDGLVQLSPLLAQIPENRRWIEQPSSLSWFNAKHQFYLNTVTEALLIDELVNTLDQLSRLSDWAGDRQLEPILHLADILSQRFQAFYASCQIWGEVKAMTPELSQARLGLVRATQTLLCLLLEDVLGLDAPAAL